MIKPVTLIRKEEVKRRTGLPTSTLYKLVKDGNFPQQVRIATRCVAWSAEEVDNWIAARLASREPATTDPPP
jgi:prophage regulatory protein